MKNSGCAPGVDGHAEKWVFIYMFLQMMFEGRNLVWSVFQGFFEDTALYHGYYTSESVSTVDGLTYRIAPAYFFTVLACYLFIFVVLSVR
jgi:hypothetical protein